MTDEIDTLRTERNSALGESRLWLARYLAEVRKTDRLRRDLYESDKCLKEWQGAYDVLALDHFRLQHRYGTLQYDFRFAREMEDHFREVTLMLLPLVIASERNIFADEPA